MALMLRHANDEPPPLGLVREDLPPGVVAWVHAMLAKEPAARPASAAHAWDWLEGVVSDELGARWRRAAALPEPGDPSGYVSVVTAAVPVEAPQYSSAVLPVVATEPPPPPPEPVAVEPPAPSPNPAAPAGLLSSPAWPRPWSPRPGRRGSPSPPGRSRAPPRRPRRSARRSRSRCATSSRRPCAPTGR